jgi:glycerol kinase
VSRLQLSATGSTVTAAVESAGRTVAEAHRRVAEHSPRPGRAESRPEEIWRATLAAVAAVRDDSLDQLERVTVHGDAGTLLLWDRETLGSPYPALGPDDRRAQEVCDALDASGRASRVRELSGRPVTAGCWGPRLSWLAAHEPHLWQLVVEDRYAVGCVASYLVARMTRGTWHLVDVAVAAETLLWDAGTGQWSVELCDIFEVPRPALPEPVPSGVPFGTTDPRSVHGLGLPVALG